MSTMIEESMAITPPNFVGIERRIAYAYRKYHSGWICRGADMGLAGEKFSVSPIILGLLDTSIVMISSVAIIGSVSFIDNSGLNFILSQFDFKFLWFDDPFSCRKIKWMIMMTIIIIGKMKCRE